MIESAQYADDQHTSIRAVIDGRTLTVPADEGNRDYRVIQRAVNAGDLTIAEPDQPTLEEKRQGMVLTLYQAEAALLDAGLLDDVEALMDDPDTPQKVRIMWRRKDRIHRTHPTTIEMANALGWTDEQLDGLFRAGMEIEG